MPADDKADINIRVYITKHELCSLPKDIKGKMYFEGLLSSCLSFVNEMLSSNSL